METRGQHSTELEDWWDTESCFVSTLCVCVCVNCSSAFPGLWLQCTPISHNINTSWGFYCCGWPVLYVIEIITVYHKSKDVKKSKKKGNKEKEKGRRTTIVRKLCSHVFELQGLYFHVTKHIYFLWRLFLCLGDTNPASYCVCNSPAKSWSTAQSSFTPEYFGQKSFFNLSTFIFLFSPQDSNCHYIMTRRATCKTPVIYDNLL